MHVSQPSAAAVDTMMSGMFVDTATRERQFGKFVSSLEAAELQQLQQDKARAPQKFGKEQVVEEEEVSLQIKIGKVAKLKSPGPQGTHIS